MASKDELLKRLGTAKRGKKEEVPKAPEPTPQTLDRDVPTDGQRIVADATAKDAMVMGWDLAIQKHAYENRIPEDEVKRLLDQALEYNDKADPSGRILELEDWRIQKQGRSNLKPRT